MSNVGVSKAVLVANAVRFDSSVQMQMSKMHMEKVCLQINVINKGKVYEFFIIPKYIYSLYIYYIYIYIYSLLYIILIFITIIYITR